MKKRRKKREAGITSVKKNFKNDKRWLLPYKATIRGVIHNIQKKSKISLEESENLYIERQIAKERREKGAENEGET